MSIKVKYTYESPWEEEKVVIKFTSIKEFLSHRRGEMFKSLLTKDRAEVTDKITFEISYPANITLEFIKE